MQEVLNWKMQIANLPGTNKVERQIFERVGDHLVALIISGNYIESDAAEFLQALTTGLCQNVPLGALPGQERFVKEVKLKDANVPAPGLEGFNNWSVVDIKNNNGDEGWFGIQEQFGPYDILIHVVGSFADNGREYTERLCQLMNMYFPLGTLPNQQAYVKDVAIWYEHRRNITKKR